jgi:hypothetical protein
MRKSSHSKESQEKDRKFLADLAFQGDPPDRIHAREKILLSVLHGIILEPDEMLILQRIAESGYNEAMALCRVLVKVRQAPPLHGG